MVSHFGASSFYFSRRASLLRSFTNAVHNPARASERCQRITIHTGDSLGFVAKEAAMLGATSNSSSQPVSLIPSPPLCEPDYLRFLPFDDCDCS